MATTSNPATASYIRVDYDDGTATVVVTWLDGGCEDVIAYENHHGTAKAQAERMAKCLARNHGCDWGCNY